MILDTLTGFKMMFNKALWFHRRNQREKTMAPFTAKVALFYSSLGIYVKTGFVPTFLCKF